MANYRLRLARVNSLKLRVSTRIPANLVGNQFITITRGDNGEYNINADYSILTPGPISDPTTAYVAIQDQTAGIYRTVTLASLLTSGLDADLQAIAALTGTGILSRTADGTWALRTLQAPAAGLTITNPGGVAGNETFALANDLAALEGLASTGIAVRSAADTWVQRSVVGGASITITNGDGVAGNISVAVTDPELVALAGLVSAADRLPYFTGSGTASLATFTAFGRSLVDDADASAARTTLGVVIGTDVQSYDSDLAAIAALATTGLLRRTGTNTWTLGTTISTTEIADDAVTYAKMQNVSAASRILGRKTAGAGDLEELTLSDALDFIGSATQGDILFRGSATWSRLGAGTSGQFLQTLGSGANPQWATASGGGGSGREVLTANRTYYVRTDGSDSNNGLANTSGGAFLTIQKAVNVTGSLDIAGYNVTIQVADGTYTGAINLMNVPGFSSVGNLVIQGNNTTPANVVISTTSADCFKADTLYAVWDIKDLKMQTAMSGSCINAVGAKVRFGNVNFGVCANSHLNSSLNASIQSLSNYAVSGGATDAHVQVATNGFIDIGARTITFSNSPAFGNFCLFTVLGMVYAYSNTFTNGGTVTGMRYFGASSAIAITNGGGANYFPGSVAGSSTGAVYL